MNEYPDAPNHLDGSREIDTQNQALGQSFSISTAGLKMSALFAGVLMMAAGLWLSALDWSDNSDWFSWGALVTGFLLFLLGKRMDLDAPLPEKIAKPLYWLANTFQLNGWQLLCFMVSPFLSLLAFWAAGTGMLMNNSTMAISLWLTAILFVVVGGLWPFSPAVPKISKKEIAILALLVLVAGIIRGLSISKIPVVLSGDEASSGISAIGFIEGSMDNIFRIGWYSFPAFHNWIQSIPIRIFGQTIFALRFASIFIGSITVGVVYDLGKAMFNQWTGLFAGVFLAAYHFHHHFSRIGLNNIWDAFWFAWVLGAVWYGWRREKRWPFVLGGLGLGFSQYFYVTSRLLIFLVLVWILVGFLTDRDRFRTSWPKFVLMAIIALVVILPMAGFFIKNPDEYTAPFVRVSIMGDWLAREVENSGLPGWLIILKQLGSSFLGLVSLPLRFWYLPGVPLLRTASATLFLVGLGSLLLKPRDTRLHLLGLWILAICIPGGLSESVPAAQRYVAIAPALAILVGYGLEQIAAQIGQVWNPPRNLVYYLALLAMVVLCIGELRFYYFEYTPDSEFGGTNSLVAQRLADSLEHKTTEWQVLFWGAPRMGYYSIPSLQYLVPEIEGLDMTHPWGSPDNPQPTSNQLVFVLLPDHEGELPAIQDDFPDGILTRELDRKGQPLYWLYEVTPAIR
jgi:4-amino-4-deoxy-L-arabinose transferase-like glycosyltransferase